MRESWRVWVWGLVIFCVGLVITLAISKVPGYVIMTLGGVMAAWFAPRHPRA